MKGTARRCALATGAAVVLLLGACGRDDPAATPSRGTAPGTTSSAGSTSGTTTAPSTTATESTPSTPSTPATPAAPTTPAPATRPTTTTAPPTTPTTALRAFRNIPAGVRVEVMAQDLAAPWSLAFTPDGATWVTERGTGRLLTIDGGVAREVMTLPVAAGGEGGLLGVVASPAYASDGTLYVYFTAADDNRVVKVRPADRSVQPIVTGIPKGVNHDGGRLAFGPDGLLYIGTGDAGDGDRAQDLGSLGGKILRVAPDGSIPPGNPFGTAVWSYGHRNVQGLAWDPTGRMYATEFGPSVDDEINIITPGANYGWPDETGDSGGRFTDPVLVLQPGDASPSGLTYVEGDSAWAGDLLFGALRGERVYRAELAADGTIERTEELFRASFGRIRLVTQAPDGSIWLLTNNRDGRGAPDPGDDLVLRITPPT